jgi:hypothetical protein
MAETNGLYVPKKILCDDQIGSTQKLVYSLMVSEMGEDRICRMSARQIAERLHVTPPVAQNARLVLVNRGYIRLIPQTMCDYQILHFRKKRRENDA